MCPIVIPVVSTAFLALATSDAEVSPGLPSAEAVLFFSLALLVYLLPGLIANHRKHQNWVAILLTNIFLGWTVVGWIAALVWAASSTGKINVVVNVPPAPQPQPPSISGPPGFCHHCGAPRSNTGDFCIRCGVRFD